MKYSKICQKIATFPSYKFLAQFLLSINLTAACCCRRRRRNIWLLHAKKGILNDTIHDDNYCNDLLRTNVALAIPYKQLWVYTWKKPRVSSHLLPFEFRRIHWLCTSLRLKFGASAARMGHANLSLFFHLYKYCDMHKNPKSAQSNIVTVILPKFVYVYVNQIIL